jgi:3-methyladenine DNA glycosylase
MGERCGWCGDDPLYVAYHDDEWGRPVHDSKPLFAKLILDGFQAGLAWITILRKRDAFYAAFAGLDPDVIADWGEPDVVRLLGDAGIVRHRGKIEAAIGNARAWQQVEATHPGGFSALIWDAVGGEQVDRRVVGPSDYVATDPRTDALSKQLKKLGFRFCGPTIVYAFAQAVGMFNDHLVSCSTHDLCLPAE